MPGEKMLKNIESVKGDDKIDAHELHNALKELDKGEITRGLNHKIDKIKTVDGIHDATRDLLTKIESSDKNIKLSKDQVHGLYALHALLNPNEDGSTVNIKKIDKPEVINNVHFQNLKNVIEFEGSSYGFAGWEQGINDAPIVGSAEVLEGTSTMYFIPFTLDGKLDFSKGSSTIPGSIDIIARGFDGKALPNAEKKVAYIQDGKLVIEKSDVYAQKMKNKEFVEKLNNVTVPGLFLTQLLDTDPGKGNMKVAYLSDAAIIDAVSSGKYGLTKFQKEYDDAIAPLLSLSNGDDRNTKIAEIHKNFLPKYKDYIKENTSSVLIQLPNDVFEVDLNSTLINPISSTKLTVDGKKDQEQVDNYKSLDGGNIILSIVKEGNATSWNVYTKKDGTSYGVDNSQKLIDPNAPVVTTEKPKDVVLEDKDLLAKINALTEKFMFTGGSGSIADKDTATAGVRSALRKLSSDPARKDMASKIVDNLTNASKEINKSESQRKLIKQVQTDLNTSVSGIAGSVDGYRGQKTQDALLVFAGMIKKQPQKSPSPVSTPNTPSPAPKTAETKKPTIDALATERKQLIDLQETAKKELNPLLKKLVPDANGMNDYIKHLPKGYTQQLTILDQTLKMDPKTISDKIAFEKVYPSMSINVKNLTLSLNTLNKKTAKDYSDFFLLPHNKSQVNTVLASVTKFQNAKLDNSRSNDLQKGYIKFADPTNKYLSSRFPANFLSSPTYRNGERKLLLDTDMLKTLVENRLSQKDFPNGPTPNIAASMFS